MHRFLWFPAVLLLLGGCAATAEGQATDDARDRAREIGRRLYDNRVRPARDVAHLVADQKDVEVMRVDGTSTAEGNGVHVTVRLSGNAYGRPSSEPITVVRCFELRFSLKSEWDEKPRDVDCPPGKPLTFGPWPKTPEIPDEKLAKALPRVPRGGSVDERKVREAVASLGLDPAIHVEIGSQDGVVGVLLRVKPYLDDAFDCTLARIAPGSTNVWSPPRIQRMPGEGGCFIANALNPLPPPH